MKWVPAIFHLQINTPMPCDQRECSQYFRNKALADYFSRSKKHRYLHSFVTSCTIWSDHSWHGENQYHDDVIKWRHFPCYWPFVRGNSPHKGQWRGASMFSLICAWINAWVNNRKAGDLKRTRAHYNVSVMTGSEIKIPVDGMAPW